MNLFVWQFELLCPRSKGEGRFTVCVCLSVTNFYCNFLNNYSLQMLEILAHSFFWHAIWWDSFLYESDVNILFIRASVHWVYNKYFSQFPQHLFIADAWNFSTLFLMACHIVGIVFVWVECQLPVYPCVWPQCITNFCHSFLNNYSSQAIEILAHSLI
jgi:hypothetical protein